MLVIVNPYATTVSDRLKNLVVYALQGRYEVEAVSTEAQNHATEIGHEACEGGYDVVVAFGGDGTLNDVADATEHLLSLADDFRPRKVDLGRANGRRFARPRSTLQGRKSSARESR